MKCPKCHTPSEVTHSGPTDDGNAMFRRRRCASCGHRFSTIELPTMGGGAMTASRILREYWMEEGRRQAMQKTITTLERDLRHENLKKIGRRRRGSEGE